jgi:hypothetical protein
MRRGRQFYAQISAKSATDEFVKRGRNFVMAGPVPAIHVFKL